MSPREGRIVLPEVDGWGAPPTVRVPIYEIAPWVGPKWLVLYDGTDTRGGLRLVHLVYGESGTGMVVAGIITFTKQPAQDLGDGCWIAGADLPSVADYALLQLLSRLSGPSVGQDSRRAWERARFAELSNGVSGPGWTPVSVHVGTSQVRGHQAHVDGGTVICVDAGEVFIGMYFARPLPGELVLLPLADLSGYPMPSDANHPKREP